MTGDRLLTLQVAAPDFAESAIAGYIEPQQHSDVEGRGFGQVDQLGIEADILDYGAESAGTGLSEVAEPGLVDRALTTLSGAYEAVKSSRVARKAVAATAMASIALPGAVEASGTPYHKYPMSYLKANCKKVAKVEPGYGITNVRKNGIHAWSRLEHTDEPSGGAPHYFWTLSRNLRLCSVVASTPRYKKTWPDPENLTRRSGEVRSPYTDTDKAYVALDVYARPK